MVEFAKQDWLVQHRQQNKGRLKRALYFFLRPLLSRRYSRYLTPETIKKCRPRWVLGSRGMPLVTRRRWGAKYLPNLRHATLLVQVLEEKRRYPREFRKMVEKYAGRCTPDDLLIKAHLLILQKPAEPR